MVVSEEDKRKIIDLYFNQQKTIREVCKIMGKSSYDITPVTKEHRIRLAQNCVPDLNLSGIKFMLKIDILHKLLAISIIVFGGYKVAIHSATEVKEYLL